MILKPPVYLKSKSNWAPSRTSRHTEVKQALTTRKQVGVGAGAEIEIRFFPSKKSSGTSEGGVGGTGAPGPSNPEHFKSKMGVAMLACNPSTLEAEIGEWP